MFGFGKGKIDIKINKYNFSPGETIEGTITLKLKKPLKAKGVKIRLVGEKKITERRGTSTAYRTINIFDFDQPLDGEKEYSTEEISYPFKITIPRNVSDQTMPEGMLGNIAKIAQAVSGASSRIKWYLKAYLDIPMGFDVSKKVQINVA